MPRLQRVLHSADIWALYGSYMLWPHVKRHITTYKVKATSHVQVNLGQVLGRFSVGNRNEASAFPFLAFALLTGIGTRWLHWRGEQIKYICENGVGSDHTDNDCDTNTDIVHLVDYPSQFPDGTKCSGPPKSFPDPEDCQMFYYCYRGCVTHNKVENIVSTIYEFMIKQETNVHPKDVSTI